MTTLTQGLACFVTQTRFEDLPPRVVAECKRLLLDTIGCASTGNLANAVAAHAARAGLTAWIFVTEDLELGKLVGKRTWGGLVGVSQYPTLMDGGNVTAPNFGFFSPTGDWEVENSGIPPDIEVENDPASVASMHSPENFSNSASPRSARQYPVPSRFPLTLSRLI